MRKTNNVLDTEIEESTLGWGHFDDLGALNNGGYRE
ncbi:rrna biogenesis protein rrp5 [Pyrenophora tritici-repentis]|nr:rrna biogenesis protein rrp5 [Pyrenophora tritici-repentis]KAF7449480.1 rrna biogenesis protein rrp5 [Pyrenophora tritici-repentis]KAG9383578.1 rrna biogenesis protein rrp5 [Pyrenophora tritici-repentis]KAI2484454.1 rrna biogenesis protein rrp5 [Pyrenophora tritici-repentis]